MLPRHLHLLAVNETAAYRLASTIGDWRRLNPDWEIRVWTPSILEDLVRDEAPEILSLFAGYPNGRWRIAAGRFALLKAHGGVAIDPVRLTPVSVDRFGVGQGPLFFSAGEDDPAARVRGLGLHVDDAVLSGPPHHPFWNAAIEGLVHCRHARDTRDGVGDLFLSGMINRYPDKGALDVRPVPPSLLVRSPAESRAKRKPGRWIDRLSSIPASLRHRMAGRFATTPEQVLADVDHSQIKSPTEADFDVETCRFAVLIPIRDAESHVPRCLELIGKLDVPKANLKLVFCEGDSQDGTRAALEAALSRLDGQYRAVRLTSLATGVTIDRSGRWETSLQRRRRAGIARVRNHLITEGLDETDDWALWIDADVIDYSPTIVRELLAVQATIVTPHCVKERGGRSYDLNAFVDVGTHRDADYYRHCADGLFQPPMNFPGRRYLHDLRYLDRVPLTGVGGTMLLVHASVHRSGLHFPDQPCGDLIETEAFGLLAGRLGLPPLGLPNVEIVHV